MSTALIIPTSLSKKADRPLFSAERAMLASRRAEGPSGSADNGQILAAIAAMQAEIVALRQDVANLTAGNVAAVPEDVPCDVEMQKAAQVHQENISHLKTELRALSVCIAQTKAEIASIHPSTSGDDHLSAVSNELDAVVASTERATTDILDAVESVETQVRNIKSHVSDAYVTGLVDDILEKLISVLEACNFQDITGQRITKVVNTLKFVEERVSSMIKIWGEDAVREASDEAVLFGGHRPESEDNHLLNGPQLDGEGIKQSDIDALFD